jgi:hypothetical protein
MITPKLEELILCGKAFFKTAVIGGSKTTIDINDDRFIIITDITYLGYQNLQAGAEAAINTLTQLSIYGERGFNHYMFRNKMLGTGVFYDPSSGNASTWPCTYPLPHQTINCYLLHTTQVGFSFLISNNVFPGPTSSLSIAAANNPAFEPPLDYGKDGMPGAINIDSDITVNPGLTNQVVNRLTGLGIGSSISQQVQLPASAITKPVTNLNHEFAVANINYIEILGQPNNIGI